MKDGTKLILCVDDDIDLLELLRMQLQKAVGQIAIFCQKEESNESVDCADAIGHCQSRI